MALVSGGRDHDLRAFVLDVAAYTAPAGSDPVAVLAGYVHRARALAHDYYLGDECTCTGDPDEDESSFDPACPVHGSQEDGAGVRLCAACLMAPAADGDRYCPGCGSARDREAWTTGAHLHEPASVVPAYCRAVLIVQLEVGRVSHHCQRPAGHAGEHRSDLRAANGRDPFTWSVAELVP